MAAMHFWGVEVKGKEANSVKLEDKQVIHVSQATLGEVKKDNEPVVLTVKVGDKKLVMGILSQSNPQLSFDLVFDEDFVISHNWKNGSVHLLGYDTEIQDEEDYSVYSSSEDEEEPIAVPPKANGKVTAPVASKPAVKPTKDVKPKSALADVDDSDDDDSEDDDSDEDMVIPKVSDDSDDDDSEDDDDVDSDEEEETPTPKAVAGKKRSKSEAKTPEPKKAKLATPQKTDGKKGGAPHTATPHPSKKGAKSPAAGKSTPKSGGQITCGSCTKTFNSEVALQSHSKAKHSAK